MKDLGRIVVLPPVIEEVSKEGFLWYTAWMNYWKILEKSRDAFKERVIEEHGKSHSLEPHYRDDGKLIYMASSSSIKVGSIKFYFGEELTEGSPSYKNIMNSFNEGLSYTQGKDDTALKRGYIALDAGRGQEIFVKLELLKKPIEEAKRKTSVTCSYSLALAEPKDLAAEVPDILVVDDGPLAVTESCARQWVLAGNMAKEAERRLVGYSERTPEYPHSWKRIPRFKELLLEDSLKREGLKEKEFEGVARVYYPFDSIVYVHQMEGRRVARYSAVVDAFMEPLPETICRGTRAGDFSIAEKKNSKLWDELIEKKVVDNAFRDDYSPRVIGGKVYVRLQGIRNRLARYMEENNEHTIEQDILAYSDMVLQAAERLAAEAGITE